MSGSEGSNRPEFVTLLPVRFPNLRPSSTAISVRLPDTLLVELKLLANERDVPYQSLMKLFLADRVRAERLPPSLRAWETSRMAVAGDLAPVSEGAPPPYGHAPPGRPAQKAKVTKKRGRAARQDR